ncbi:hypothetical protein AAFC00_005034 [Neodothiora populina]|uniref:Carrier domain-containing protein n=1 Tax=Neodothiora populina TaxID=2781224 RepID=A0ABR3P4T9_9PEZI
MAAQIARPAGNTPYSDSISTKPHTSFIEDIDAVNPHSESVEAMMPSTVDQLIRLRSKQLGHDRPIVAYPEDGTRYTNYTPEQLDLMVESMAVHYSQSVTQRCSSDDPVEVVAVLGPSDLDYMISFLAISRLGHSVLLLSTRITDEAHMSLLEATKATTLLYHTSHQSTAESLRVRRADLETIEIHRCAALNTHTKLGPAYMDPARESGNISFIIHSSGSTGLPKPIYQTHKASLYAYSVSFERVGHITLPLFHNHGLCCLFRAIWARKKIYIYNARLPLTSSHLVATLQQHPDIRILYAVPYALKLLSETDEGVALLRRLDIVMFGGSACPKPIGDKLVENGVNLVGHYGATELGQLMTSFRDHPSDNGWDWLRVPLYLKPYLRMENRGSNLYELCIKDGWPSKVATNRDDGSYATKDLFEPHPDNPDTWRYYARLDDTIVLENGEKANPLAHEGAIRQDEQVAEAIVFGANKAQLGAFVIPAPTSTMAEPELIDRIMIHVKEGNKLAPAYAQLSRDMIRVLPQDTNYRRTDKGTVIRVAFYRDFEDEINDMYTEEQSGSLVLPREELLEFLRNEFSSKIALRSNESLLDTTDLFSLGIDSLQAIQARSSIVRSLKVNAKDLGRNFVFDFPTLSSMADELLRIQSGAPRSQERTVEELMADMIERYSQLSIHRPVERTADGHYIILTGVTGSLGAHAVAILARHENVRRVYCLVRASSDQSARERLEHSLRERRLLNTLPSTAMMKMVALPSDLSETRLGLTPEQYDTISDNTTHVLHFAWSVNFNKGISSFEKDCIAGVHNLINLCLEVRRPVPASFNFCSSVSATVRTPGGFVPEALPTSLSYAQGMGYAQSKLVAENLCNIAMKQTNMKARVLRVGQIIGDTANGIWNETEAIPLIFQSAESTASLPNLDENPAWLPVDDVAKTCIEITLSSAGSGVMNIANPRTFHWTRDLLPLLRSAGLKFDIVDRREWIRRLRASNPNPKKNPSIKLVEFFSSKYDNDNILSSIQYATDLSRKFSTTLQEARVIDATLVRKIVEYLEGRWSSC